jgi:hypothetical protein
MVGYLPKLAFITVCFKARNVDLEFGSRPTPAGHDWLLYGDEL